jgi:hypothetical protein
VHSRNQDLSDDGGKKNPEHPPWVADIHAKIFRRNRILQLRIDPYKENLSQESLAIVSAPL